jgi:Fur family ferric uptake transcriptional regulator
MSDAAALARLAGLRPTPQRVAIIEALDGKDRAVAEAFAAGEGEQAYKLCQPAHHHHLICERCGLVVTIPSCEVEDWAAAVARRRGYSVTGHRADVYGLCERCRRS